MRIKFFSGRIMCRGASCVLAFVAVTSCIQENSAIERLDRDWQKIRANDASAAQAVLVATTHGMKPSLIKVPEGDQNSWGKVATSSAKPNRE